MTFTADQKLAAIERELSMRRRVYPRRILTGNMTAELAARQIAIMESIAEDYRAQVDAGRLL